MTDDLEHRRRGRRETGVRRVRTGPPTPQQPSGPPAWVFRFIIPRDACEPCAAHLHHRCHGVNVLLDPVPDCPCDCGDRKDPMRLNHRAWADLSLHAPDQVWIAAMFERQRAAGIFMCTQDERGPGLRAWKEPRR
jgi:hypothetical protein